MLKHKWIMTLSLLTAMGLWISCASSPKYLTSFNGPFTVKVLPTGPPTWSYDITASNQTGITSVEIISSANLEAAQIEVEPTYRNHIQTQVTTAQGVQLVLDRTSKHDLSFSITGKDFKNGLISFRITGEGGISRVVGPVAGPQ